MSSTSAARKGWALSLALSLVWLVAVVATGTVGRVVDHWESAVTMLFGSFLAGSSPEGGGAVAFPVFTKALHVPSAVARTFGLCIQAVGMTVAAIAIIVNRRPIHRRATVLASGFAVLGFLVSAVAFGNHGMAFWPTSFGPGWTKATFSIVLATTSVMMILHLRHRTGDHVAREWTARHDVGLAVAALAGGVLSSLAGTGANILVFLFLVVLVDVSAKVALPSALIVMAAVSVAGFALFGLLDGQLFVELDADRVTSVGGVAADLPAKHNDLLGLWLAAVPVVVWGAPLGSWAAARVKEATLVVFVACLAAAEVLTTFVLVDELRTNGAMLAYLIIGLVAFPTSLILLRQQRATVFATAPGPP